MARARKSTRRPRRRAAGKRVARKSKRSLPKESAVIQETIELSDLGSATTQALVFNLSQFTRASALAPNFRWYKAMKVEWGIEPLFNTFQDGVTGDTMPYLYKLMDRTQNSLNMNLQDFQASGCKPIKLISKKSYSYVPNWCSPGLTSIGTNTGGDQVTKIFSQGLKAQYSYLASPDDSSIAPNQSYFITPLDTRNPPPANDFMAGINVNQVTYNGMDIYIDQNTNVGVETVARLTCTVTWHFKGAKFNHYIRDPVPKTTV